MKIDLTMRHVVQYTSDTRISQYTTHMDRNSYASDALKE